MYKPILFIAMALLVLGSCNKAEKSEKSEHAAGEKVLDKALAEELQNQKNEAVGRAEHFNMRFMQIVMLINEQMFIEEPKLFDKYNDLLSAQAEFYDAKGVYDMQKSDFTDRLLDVIASSNTKEEIEGKSRMLLDELRVHSEEYMGAAGKLVNKMSEAGIQSPVLEEIMMEGAQKNEQAPE